MQQEDKACFVQGGRELAEAAYKTGFDDGFEAAVYSLMTISDGLKERDGAGLPSEIDPFEQLTPREREVAELVQTGMKNLEISVKLNITETTLRVHLRRIYRKLGIQGRSNLRDFNSL